MLTNGDISSYVDFINLVWPALKISAVTAVLAVASISNWWPI